MTGVQTCALPILRAMLLVEGTLAKVQGELGIIPLDSALYIHRASMEVQVDPAGLAAGMIESGNPVSALVTAFAKAMEAPEHSKYIHWGINAQNITDTTLVLRLRQYLSLIRKRLEILCNTLADEIMQSLLLDHLDQMDDIQNRLRIVQFTGGSDNVELGNEKPPVVAALAEVLRLSNSISPSSDLRKHIALMVKFISQVAQTLEKIGQAETNTIHREVLTAMAKFTAHQANQLDFALDKDANHSTVDLALERLTLGQVCIAVGVSTKHALLLAENV